MKRIQGASIFGMMMILMTGLVSAGPVKDAIAGYIGLIFGGVSSSGSGASAALIGDLMFAKLLFFFIILVVVYGAIKKIPMFGRNAFVLWTISLGVSILSVRFLGDVDFIQALILPYSVMGIAISAIIPFIIYYFVVNGLPPYWRRFSWIMFALVFLGLFQLDGQ